MKLNQECQCVRLCVRPCDVHVCVCSPSGSFRLLLMRGTYRDKGVPPPTSPPPHRPAKPLCHLLLPHTHTHTYSSRHSCTPSHLNLTRKIPHIRPIVETAFFLNPLHPPPPPPRREDLQYNHCKCPARHSINPNP